MLFKEIMVYGNPILREKALAVTSFDGELVQYIDEMYQTMYRSHGIGLAAPQIGLNKRIIVIDIQEYEGPKIALINPKIISRSRLMETDSEGCLSVPGVRAQISRAKKIQIEAQDAHGEVLRFSANDFYARVIQHEIDHLDGILFPDRIDIVNKEMRMQLKNLEKIGKVAVA